MFPQRVCASLDAIADRAARPMTSTRTSTALALAAMLMSAESFATPEVLEADNKIFAAGEIPPGAYSLVKDHTALQFEAGHFGLSAFLGRFDEIDGELDFAPLDLKHSFLTLKIMMSSVDTRIAKLDEHLRTADFFDVQKFPQAIFLSTAIVALNRHEYEVTGNLTLHGITRPLAVRATFNGGSVNPFTKLFTVGFSGNALFKRSDFGITTFIPQVSDVIALRLETEFSKNPAALGRVPSPRP
jgi:polyisoprenoid-binding protein YceI